MKQAQNLPSQSSMAVMSIHSMFSSSLVPVQPAPAPGDTCRHSTDIDAQVSRGISTVICCIKIDGFKRKICVVLKFIADTSVGTHEKSSFAAGNSAACCTAKYTATYNSYLSTDDYI